MYVSSYHLFDCFLVGVLFIVISRLCLINTIKFINLIILVSSMLTVSILINGHPLYSRSAVNISKDDVQPQRYKVDTGEIIEHNQEDGAVALSHKLLNTIRE